MPIKKSEVIEFLAQQLEKQDFKNIRTRLSGEPNPKGIIWEKGDTPQFPDLTAEKDDAIGLFSVVENPSKMKEEDVVKYKLFSAFTEQRKGKHFLVTESSVVDHLELICNKNDIQAEILPIERSQSA